MPISKRLRFEIFRRDNHACRYCGRSTPEVKLTIDHVTPVSLGGTNDPANLVTACADCNAGKTSMPADAAIVEDVAADALRWAKAMEIVADNRAVQRLDARERYERFRTKWNSWTYKYCGEWRTIELPPNWRSTVDQFLDSGLEMADLHDLVDVAMGARTNDEWRYFCGCCWRRIKQAQEDARAIIETWEVEDKNG
jgi:hypothetical protein